MLERINPRSGVAVFAQLENEIRFAIASGELKAGDKLPTVRAVAETLGINPNTVAKAYRDLEIMGLVYSRRGMGIFIKDGVEDKCRADCYREILSKIHEVVAEARAAGFKESEVRTLAKKCFSSNTSPYDVPPENILALVKGKK
jgi:GntR family transcriptional regulator